jgi:hypothetical protein
MAEKIPPDEREAQFNAVTEVFDRHLRRIKV